MTKLFVWLSNQSGPIAQLWHEEPVTGENKPRFTPLFQYKLTDEEEQDWNSGFITLDDLRVRFAAEIPANKEVLLKSLANPQQPNEELKKLMQE